VAKILSNELIAPRVFRMIVSAPEVAHHHKAGQFVIVRPTSVAERIPLTIADSDASAGTVTLIYQVVGKTTGEMSLLQAGSNLTDIAGPLGRPTHVDHFGTVIGIGGGIGIAPLHPIAKAMKQANNRVISVLGARTKDLLILETEMQVASTEIRIVTDDGSAGQKGFVTDALQRLIKEEPKVDLVVAIGPPIMMKFVSELTRPLGIKTLVSLNTIMVDGTGMCGGCRVSVGNEVKFVCVDGPEFDGHLVDFGEMMKRQNTYKEAEKVSFAAFQKQHVCHLERMAKEVSHG